MTEYMRRKLKKEIKDPATSEARLIELMNMDLGLAFAVAEFGTISGNLIDELIQSPDNYLRDALSRNPRLTTAHLQKLCTDEFLPARYKALRRLLWSVCHEGADVPLEWFQNFIATCPDDLMVKQIKFHLLEDVRTSETVLQTLAQDPDEDVRQRAQQKLKAVV
jgi:hypothetical protein